MKRLLTTLVIAGLFGLAGLPQSAEAGLLSRWLGRNSSCAGTTTTAADTSAAAEVGRRYSYEPAAAPSVTRSSADGVLPGQRHLLPKTDPRRYQGN